MAARELYTHAIYTEIVPPARRSGGAPRGFREIGADVANAPAPHSRTHVLPAKDHQLNEIELRTASRLGLTGERLEDFRWRRFMRRLDERYAGARRGDR